MRIGIRREDKGVWECRVPLTPEAVRTLTPQHQFVIQPCTKRIFPNHQYEQVSPTFYYEM